jgi:uncharacterized repeat protein (TIGR01451 family)
MTTRRNLAFALVVLSFCAFPASRFASLRPGVHAQTGPGPKVAAVPADSIAEKRKALDEAIANEKANPSKATSLAVEAALADYNAAVSGQAAALLDEMRELESQLAKPTPEGDTDTKVHSPARGDRRRVLATRYEALRAQFVRVASRSTNVLGSTTESEPNGTAGTATPLDLSASCGIASGAISPAGDVDFYSFTAPAGARVWAYVDTGGPTAQGSQSRDSLLTLFGTDGTTVLERDDEDGSGNGCDSTTESLSASAIAGHVVAAAGTYYVEVEDFPGVPQTIDPYRLYVVVTTGESAEVEPNDTGLQANTLVPAGQSVGVRSGALSASGDVDIYSVEVENGASLLYISADADPERDGTGTDVAIDLFTPEAGTLLFTSEGTVSLDALAPLGSIGGVTPLYTADSSDQYGSPAPPAEGFCFLAPSAGTYYVRVRSTNSGAGTYSVMAAACAVPPYGCPPFTISGTLGQGSPDFPSQSGMQIGRLTRTRRTKICGIRSPCPGIFDPTGARRYDAYRFGNNSDEQRCVTVSVSSSCPGTVPVFAVVYENGFNPDDLCENYAADSGLSVNQGLSRTFSFDVGPHASFTLVLHEVTPGSSCGDYQFTVAGLPGCADPPTDLVLTMRQFLDPVVPGDVQSYAILVSNPGVTTLENVVLTVPIPAHTTFLALTPPRSDRWTCTTPPQGGTGTVTCTTPALIGGMSEFFALVVIVDRNAPDGTKIAATATATTTTPETDPTNNSATVSTEVHTSASVGTFFLTYPSVAPVGGLMTFKVVVTNGGADAAKDVRWAISVPTGTTFVSLQGPAGWTCTAPPVGGTGDIVCTIPTLPVFDSAIATVTVRVDEDLPEGTQVASTSKVSSSTADPNPSDNTVTAIATAAPAADLAVTITQTPNPAPVGGYIAYEITVTNSGPSDAQSVDVVNVLPTDVTFVSCEASDGGTCGPGGDPQTVHFASIPAGSGVTATVIGSVSCSVSDGSALVDSVMVNSSTYELDPSNNQAVSSGTAASVVATIACPGNVTTVANTPWGAAVTFPPPVVTPAGVLYVCTPASGSVFPIGTTAVTCSVPNACGTAPACGFNVTVLPAPFNLCAVDDATGDYYKAVTGVPSSNPSYGYWEYHNVNGPGSGDDQVFYGFANQVTTTNRLVKLADEDDPTYSMGAVFNRRTGRAEVAVKVLSTGVRYRLTDASTFNSSCP